jgi:hypothetical protein
METNRNELIDLADKVERQAADETEPGPLIELGEEIKYRQDNVTSIARLLKGNIHEEFKERAQRALDESMEAARVGQQKLDAFQASFRDDRSRWEWLKRRTPASRRERRARAWENPKGRPAGGSVSDGKGLYQPACQEEWKKCKKEEE